MILTGDCREILPLQEDNSIDCVVTSPPYYGLRNYEVDGQIGMEETPDAYVSQMVKVFHEVKRVLRDDGTLWLNIGDSYARGGTPGCKPKDMIGIPWRVAFALQSDGWYLRQDIIWSKPNVMPESVTDRCTKSHEYIFLLSKSPKYYFDSASIAEPCITNDKSSPRGSAGVIGSQNSGRRGDTKYSGKVYPTNYTRNKRDVWVIPTQPFSGAHFATYPEELVRTCILAGCHVGGTVLDPFSGSGTTGKVSFDLSRQYIGIELNPEYATASEKRIGTHIQQTLGSEGV